MPECVPSDPSWPAVLPSVFPSVRSGPPTWDPSPRNSSSPQSYIPLPEDPVSPFSERSVGSPFTNRQEARLFMHYARNIAPWLDICDKHCHFGKDVPRRAFRSPLLACTILAFSSFHLSTTTGSETTSSATYYSNALQILIPILDGPIEVLNEDVLAAIAMLRLYEEMQDDDFCAHLAGSSRLLNSLSSLAANGGLGEAASWLALRQDIYISLTRSQPLSISLDGYTKSASLVQLDAESMANRAVFTCARVLAYAMGPSPEHDMGSQATDTLSEEVEHWHQLASQQTSCLWAEGLPAGKRNASAFPLLWMTCPAHIAGFQHIYLAKMLLNIFDPRLSRPGFDNVERRRAADQAVLVNLRMIIGLATSNRGVVNASFTACHVLQACGRYLTEKAEQEEALEFLGFMQKETGWRTRHIADDLSARWLQSREPSVLLGLPPPFNVQ